MDLMGLLDRLEEILGTATKVPLMNKVLVDADEALAVIDDMREMLPQEIREANRVSRDREAILIEAREHAELTMRQAKAKAQELISESVITQEAQQQANELIDQAKRVAREIRQNALQWADDLFERVQPELEQIAVESQRSAQAIRKAREELRQQL